MDASHIFSSAILIVDDMVYNQMMIAEYLKENGFTNIHFAATGKQAMSILDTSKIDLVLLDLYLPDQNGMEIVKILKSSDRTSDISIIIQSSTTNPEQKQEAFKLGVNDFIAKPIEKTDLNARVAAQLQQRILYKMLIEANMRMASELKDARNMLISMLPTELDLDKLANNHKISISTHYQPSSEIGGDFYDIFELEDGKIGMYLWDFSGHGVGAAINTFRLHSLINGTDKQDLNDPGKFLSRINQILYRILPRQYYATMFYGIIDPESKKLSYACASCPSPVLVSFKNKQSKIIDSKEFPLGIQNHYQYPTQELDISQWDSLILYSDALIETANEYNEYLNLDELVKTVLSTPGKTNAHVIRENLINRFNTHRNNALNDDFTLEVLSFTPMLAA